MAEPVIGGDLYRLWKISDVQLPRIAGVFYDANRDIAAETANGAFSATAAGAWADLHDELQVMFAQIGDTVLAGAEGLHRAAQAYVDADLASASALSEYMRDPANHTPGDPAAMPPTGDEAPGKPIMPTS